MAECKQPKNRCAAFRKLMSAYIDDETGAAETRSLSEHVRSCPACKRELANLYVMKEMVKSVYAPKGEVDFSSDIMARLGPVKTRGTRPEKAFVSRAFRYGMAAALLLGALGSTVLYSQSETKKMMAEKRKFDAYVVEHSEQTAASGPHPVSATVISVNFDK